MRLDADGAKLLVPVKRFIRFAVALTQDLDILHLQVVSLRPGKKLEQPFLEDIIRLDGFH